MDEQGSGLTVKGRVMAIDLGEKRIGVAVSDPTRTVASAHSVLKRKSRRQDFERIGRLIQQEEVTLLVMGLPIPLGGVEGQRAAWVRDYTADLKQHVSVPVEFWDESLSTKQAEASLRARGKRGKQIKERIDAVAAAFILQDYLNAHA